MVFPSSARSWPNSRSMRNLRETAAESDNDFYVIPRSIGWWRINVAASADVSMLLADFMVASPPDLQASLCHRTLTIAVLMRQHSSGGWNVGCSQHQHLSSPTGQGCRARSRNSLGIRPPQCLQRKRLVQVPLQAHFDELLLVWGGVFKSFDWRKIWLMMADVLVILGSGRSSPSPSGGDKQIKVCSCGMPR